jgi:hypothetical protein
VSDQAAADRAERIKAHDLRMLGLFARAHVGRGPFPSCELNLRTLRLGDRQRTYRGALANTVPRYFKLIAKAEKAYEEERYQAAIQYVVAADRLLEWVAQDVLGWLHALLHTPEPG